MSSHTATDNIKQWSHSAAFTVSPNPWFKKYLTCACFQCIPGSIRATINCHFPRFSSVKHHSRIALIPNWQKKNVWNKYLFYYKLCKIKGIIHPVILIPLAKKKYILIKLKPRSRVLLKVLSSSGPGKRKTNDLIFMIANKNIFFL